MDYFVKIVVSILLFLFALFLSINSFYNASFMLTIFVVAVYIISIVFFFSGMIKVIKRWFKIKE